MSRKGGWYDQEDDYYDDDYDDYDDDDYDDGFGAYDTGSLAPVKAKGNKGSATATAAGGAKGNKKKGAGAGGSVGAQQQPKSAMSKQMKATPHEKGIGLGKNGGGAASKAPSSPASSQRGASNATAPQGFPARPPATSSLQPGAAFTFDTPSPDDKVLAARAKGSSVGVANANGATTTSVGAAAEPAQADADTAAPTPARRPLSAYVPSADELAAATAVARHLHVVILGHVDAGKSTLTGRLLHATGMVTQRQAHRNERDAAAAGKASFSWAWALDERPEERERGVTVDVAQAHMDTGYTAVTLLDAPGHRDFVPNAIAGVAQADAAVLVVDAAPGGFESGFAPTGGSGSGGGQTREHVQLAKSLGVERLIVAVSKMDACGYSEARFEEIKTALEPFLKQTGFKAEGTVRWVPVSGFEGANLVLPGAPPPPQLSAWWSGPTLAGAIDELPRVERGPPRPLRLPVADVIPSSRTLGAAAVGGKLESGTIRKGDKVLVVPAGVIATVKVVEVSGGAGTGAAGSRSCGGDAGYAGDAVDVGLDAVDPAALSPGTVLCHPEFPLRPTARLLARIVTLEAVRVPILAGSTVVLHAYSVAVEAKVSALVHQLDPKTGEVVKTRPRCLTRNMSAVVELTTSRPVCVERYVDCKALGRLAIRAGGKTLALGVVTEMW